MLSTLSMKQLDNLFSHENVDNQQNIFSQINYKISYWKVYITARPPQYCL